MITVAKLLNLLSDDSSGTLLGPINSRGSTACACDGIFVSAAGALLKDAEVGVAAADEADGVLVLDRGLRTTLVGADAKCDNTLCHTQ